LPYYSKTSYTILFVTAIATFCRLNLKPILTVNFIIFNETKEIKIRSKIIPAI